LADSKKVLTCDTFNLPGYSGLLLKHKKISVSCSQISLNYKIICDDLNILKTNSSVPLKIFQYNLTPQIIPNEKLFYVLVKTNVIYVSGLFDGNGIISECQCPG